MGVKKETAIGRFADEGGNERCPLAFKTCSHDGPVQKNSYAKG